MPKFSSSNSPERLKEAILRLTQNQTLLTTTHRVLSLKFDSVIDQLAALSTNIFPPPSLHRNMFVTPSVTGEIPAVKMATIAVLRTLDLPISVVKGDDEKTVKYHELKIAAAEKYQPAEPHQDPPPIFRMLPQFASFPKNWPSPPSRLDTISTISLSDSRHCSDFCLFTPDLVRVSCPDRFVSTNTGSSPGKTAVNTIVVVETEKMAGNTISATPPQRFSFVLDPGVTPATTVCVVRRHRRALQKTVARTITVAALPPRRSFFIFDPGSTLRDDYHSVVCCLLPNLKFRQFHSVKFHSKPVPSSSVKYVSRSFDSVPPFGFAFFCSICINTLGSIATSLGFEWAGLAMSLIRSPFLIGPNPFQLWGLLEWKGLTPEDTSWENWDELCSLYHLEDKVVFPAVGNDRNKAPGPEKDPWPKRELKRPGYLKDYR